MPTSSHLPSRRQIAFRAGKTVARSPRGRRLALRAGKTVARSPRGRAAVWRVVRRKAAKPAAIATGTLMVVCLLALMKRGGRSSSPKATE